MKIACGVIIKELNHPFFDIGEEERETQEETLNLKEDAVR